MLQDVDKIRGMEDHFSHSDVTQVGNIWEYCYSHNVSVHCLCLFSAVSLQYLSVCLTPALTPLPCLHMSKSFSLPKILLLILGLWISWWIWNKADKALAQYSRDIIHTTCNYSNSLDLSKRKPNSNIRGIYPLSISH